MDSQTRVWRVMVLLTAVGSLVALWCWSWPALLGFLAGAGWSFANFRWFTRIALALGTQDSGGKPIPPVSAVLIAFRYMALAAGGYVIFVYSGTAFRAALAGVFIHIGAVLIEAVYELTHAGTS